MYNISVGSCCSSDFEHPIFVFQPWRAKKTISSEKGDEEKCKWQPVQFIVQRTQMLSITRLRNGMLFINT